MKKESKAIAKLKKKYSKWPTDQQPFDLKKFALNYLPASLVFWILKRFVDKTDYLLKRESTKFFQLANRAYGANQSRKCERLLRIAFKLLGSEIPLGYAKLLRFATKSTLKDPSKRRELSETILLTTKQLEQSIFDATGWYQLSRGLFSLGYFRAAWVARENSLDLSIAEGSEPGCGATVISRAIEAHLERLNLEAAWEILSAPKLLSAKSTDSFRESLQRLNKYINADSVPLISKNIDSEFLFRELVYCKSIAFVGPGSAHGEHGTEIDSADTVVRIKYVGKQYLLDQKVFGERCDISQYPGLEHLRELASISECEYFDDLQLIVTGEINSDSVRNIPVFSENQEIPTFRTTATSGLRLLISVIRQMPSSLKIFGVDFYLDSEPYNRAMKSFYEQEAWKMGDGFLFGNKGCYPKVLITYSFSAHDPVSNFCFAQNLYKAGLFDIEPFGKSILELTPYQYVERLEEMLGDW